MAEAIESRLEWGDSRSEWIREAIRERLEREGVVLETENASQ
jgi:Arc/MetJ-type ribon-helix-helix transcriptional regulator